ncbi:LytR/AlgR family response regulator transcription factor [Paraclostridium sordellii]|uniref:LytR/AlgR family response regulator transcription factor n=1 Tax=Paraclostridium sordellii TaxID=1505 RepID=UPI0005E7796B|nr:LytTR family DNA-binding domain-containing protein [Paeniclostridium sordellii]CEN81318.1 two-component response regulator VirR-like [[Clostridium] sordellii] [Paeniclostridium sordellii]CEQ15223.1 two-component response regulator VirR-like [[Clostridium] sordellii] [Paeniclostridium sordellii]CEQ20199.1 two-component response regulator VirR-like [[Clostridium] sordellii] [Paeniclostridium sordellii]
MLNIVICEDEIEQQEILKDYLEQILNEINIKYEILIFNSGEELFKNYPDNIDIFLLDIQMDGLNGMEVARKIRQIDKKEVEIIFTTSLIEYIQEGYEVRAYRYLLKPIKLEDLKKHIISCIEELTKNKESYIAVNEKNNTCKVKISEITYIEIQKREMTIHTINEDYTINSSMSKLENELSKYNFYRCHKSFMVNIDFIKNIKQYIAILDNKEEVPISRYRFKETKSRFLSYLRSVL